MSQMPIGKRIILSFGVIAVLLLCLIIATKLGIGSIVSNAGQVIDGNKLDRNLAQKEIDHLNWISKVNTLLTDENVTELNVQTDDHKCGFGKWLYGEGRKEAEHLVPELATLLKEIEVPHKRLHDSAIKIKDVYRPSNPEIVNKITEIEAGHHVWAGKIRDAIIKESTTLKIQTDPQKCMLGKWMGSDDAQNAYENGDEDYKELWDSLPESHNAMHKSAITIQEHLGSSNFMEAKSVVANETLPLLHKTVKILQELKAEAHHELAGAVAANDIYAHESVPALVEVQATLGKIRELAGENIMSEEVMLASAQKTNSTSLLIGLFAIILCIVIGFFTSRNIIKVLKDLTGRLGSGAIQIASASSQIASSSNSLADGASRQAASLEQTSASLEEMSSMSTQNSDNASQADVLMKKADTVLSDAGDSMQRLTQSMNEISTASSETQNIVKTIDEIAFQTNLLALNAAVEAARAGEAGAGFAVVADEVRNLAMRAAEAAKNTSTLIDGTVGKIKTGEALLSETNEKFTTTADVSKKVSSLIAEIAVASNEQNQGVRQVNLAVTDIDSVTQETAANAEESASASEELSAQAATMKDMVEELQVLVGQKSGSLGGGGTRPTKRSAGPKSSYVQSTPPKQKMVKSLPPVSRAAESKKKPEEIIPMDEDEFEDF